MHTLFKPLKNHVLWLYHIKRLHTYITKVGMLLLSVGLGFNAQ